MSLVSKPDLLTHEELFDAIENGLSSNNFKTSARFLMSAITDWPITNLQEPKDLIVELKAEIRDTLTFDKLKDYLKKLRPEKDAWKMESISALLEMFDFERNKSIDKANELETIVIRLTKHYREKTIEQ